MDDLSGDGGARMRTEGSARSIVVETSPANFQAWLNHGGVLDMRTSTAAARALSSAAVRTSLPKRNRIAKSIRSEQHSRLSSRPVSTSNHRRPIEDFRTDDAYAIDGNRVDLAFAIHALAHGTSETAVLPAIKSRDFSKKGSVAQQLAYVDCPPKAQQQLDARHAR